MYKIVNLMLIIEKILPKYIPSRFKINIGKKDIGSKSNGLILLKNQHKIPRKLSIKWLLLSKIYSLTPLPHTKSSTKTKTASTFSVRAKPPKIEFPFNKNVIINFPFKIQMPLKSVFIVQKSQAR